MIRACLSLLRGEMEQSGRFDGEGSDMKGDPMKRTTFVAAAFATLSFVALAMQVGGSLAQKWE